MTLKIHVLIPVLNEYSNINLLINNFSNQTYKNFNVIFCVNNTTSSSKLKDKLFLDNQRFINYFKNKSFPFNFFIMDRSTSNKSFEDKKAGVGLARKIMMDYVSDKAGNSDIIVSLDADTKIYPTYFESIVSFFQNNNALLLSIPYKHQKSDDFQMRKVMIRYEIYLQYYLYKLRQIESPYAFSALGSAMAFPVSTYKKVGGMKPYKHGEDFYFVQKVAKHGSISSNINAFVEPSSRLSSRVGVGTGPALIKGLKGDWGSYPIFNPIYFDHIKETTNVFPELFMKDIRTPLTSFLQQQLNVEDIWGPLRKNFKTERKFVRACHERLDGLRIFQYLKSTHNAEESEIESLIPIFSHLARFNQQNLIDLPITELENIHNFFFEQNYFNLCS